LADDASIGSVGNGSLGPRRLPFRRYKTGDEGEGSARLRLPTGLDAARAQSILEGVWLAATSLTPGGRPGPHELEGRGRALAGRPRRALRASLAKTCWRAIFP
jgi:hypothetical protein